MESNIIVVNLFIADILICPLRIYKNYYELPKIILGYPLGRDFRATMISSELVPSNALYYYKNHIVPLILFQHFFYNSNYPMKKSN